MADKNGNGTESILETSGADQFQGFSTKDGEVVTETNKPAAAARPAVGKAKAAKVEAGEDEGAAGEGEGEGTTPAETDANRTRSAQARIDKAVGRQRSAERERDSLRQANTTLETRLAALEARINAPPIDTNTKQKRPVDPSAPSPEDYDFGELDARYIADIARHETRKEIAAQQQHHQQQTQQTQQTAAQRDWQRRASEFKDKGLDKYDDFEDVVLDNDTPISPTLAELAFESDNGPDILYALASDLKEAKKVSALSPARQAAWFGKREAELSSEEPDADEDGEEQSPAAKSPKVPRAPSPPTTRSRGSGGQQQISAATADFAAFEKMALGSK